MHVPTLVIAPGSRGTSYVRADRLLFRAANQGFDYARFGGIFAGALQELDLVSSDDPWPDAIPASRLPNPLPKPLIPAALVTPRAAFLWSPHEKDELPAWEKRVNRLIDKHRGGHTVVLMDAHC